MKEMDYKLQFSKCNKCGNRLNCVLDKNDCAITYINDDISDDDMPHPTEISFDLKALYVTFVGNQLVITVDEKTIRALATMRPIEIHDQKQGYDGFSSAYYGPNKDISICFVATTVEEDEAKARAQGKKIVHCDVCGNCCMTQSPDRFVNCHVCGTELKYT